MDPSIITKIAAAGAMGVSVFCIYKVYDLLKTEQGKETPRPIFIKTIYISMGFAVFMTLLSLGIEVVRNNMELQTSASGIKLNQLVKKLEEVRKMQCYAVDRFGNPKKLALEFDSREYILGSPFPADLFEQNVLYLEEKDSSTVMAIKKNVNENIILGYIPKDEKAKELFSEDNEGLALNSSELFNLGVSFTPWEIVTSASVKPEKDQFLAIKYLFKILDHENKKLRENATKLLAQSNMLKKFDSNTQYEKLISVYQSGLREEPWNKYELAQVYLSRSWRSWNSEEGKLADRNRYYALLKKFVEYYDSHSWVKEYPKAEIWYNDCKKQLNL